MRIEDMGNGCEWKGTRGFWDAGNLLFLKMDTGYTDVSLCDILSHYNIYGFCTFLCFSSIELTKVGGREGNTVIIPMILSVFPWYKVKLSKGRLVGEESRGLTGWHFLMNSEFSCLEILPCQWLKVETEH